MVNLEPNQEKDQEFGDKLNANREPGGKNEYLEGISLEAGENREASPAEKEDAYTRIMSRVQEQPQVQLSSAEIAADAELANRQTDAESQVQHLVDLALAKGVMHAVKVARHMEENYIKDKFHDRMTADDLHNALVSRGLI